MDSNAARQTQTLEYSYVACAAFLVWEACVTLADEVDFLWSRPRFRWTKVAYVLLRYYALIVVILNTITWSEAVCRALRLCGQPYCTRWYVFSTGSLQVVAGLQQFLMATRVYALYGCSRGIHRTLLWAFAIEHTTITLFTAFTASSVKWSGLCVADSVSMLSIGIGLPPVLYDAMLFVLTVRKCTHGQWRRAALPTLLLRDGVWAFALVFGAFGMQGLFFLIVSGPLAGVAWPWQSAASSLAACRLVLRTHRKGAARRASVRANESMGFALTTLVPISDSKDGDDEA